MEITTQKQIQVSLFIGVLESSTVRMHLGQSHLWKQDSIIKNSETPSETHYQGKTYIGFSLPSEGISLLTLHKIEQKLRASVTHYCPELTQDDIQITIFPQILIS